MSKILTDEETALAEQLIIKARIALNDIANLEQARIDRLCQAVGWALANDKTFAIIAKMGIEESGIGDFETRLNKRFKRTEFMPFAPVVMEEYANLVFENIKGAEYTAEFMTITFDVKPEWTKKISAVSHVDNTARPQILKKKTNPLYYSIINEYYKITGIPLTINTSFNMHEEPIVCSPDDAIRSFIESGIDYLAIEKFLVKKNR